MRLMGLEPDKYPFTQQDARYYKRYRIMEKMGWTVQEYEDTPLSVVNQVWAFMNTETKVYNDKVAEHG